MERLAGLMQLALITAFVLALGGAFVPGTIGHVSGVACVVLLISAPVVRVGWLTVEWARTGDRRFAAMGGVLLGVLVVSGLLAFLR
ncbi:MAG: DUF1634 domain-containing protein [Actinobacteria bacterium]|nr:DUF1634 domain-containing protein [Actinomycetota bacterium]